MSNHPNRSAGHPARNPSPAEVRAARDAAGLTQAQAAALVHATARNWQQWEQEEGSNTRRMHPGLWELFRLKTDDSRGYYAPTTEFSGADRRPLE